MPFFLFDPTIILVIPALLLAIYAQAKVRSTYTKYSQFATRSGLTGAAVAQAILRDEGIETASDPDRFTPGSAVGLEVTPGEMSDHYDPRSRTLRLSRDVHYGNSIASLGIAAHEVGHAIQHARLYAPLSMRNVMYPVANIGSTLAFPLFLIGFFVGGGILMKAAIVMFALAVMFTVITLPVEFDASRRAVRALANGGYMTEDEIAGVRKVLNAAALTYVAATAMALLQLVRMVFLASLTEE